MRKYIDNNSSCTLDTIVTSLFIIISIPHKHEHFKHCISLNIDELTITVILAQK